MQAAAVDLDAQHLLEPDVAELDARVRSGRSARTGWPCWAPRTGAAPGRTPRPADRPGRGRARRGPRRGRRPAALSRASTTSRTAPACSQRWPVAISSSVCASVNRPAVLLAQLELHLEVALARAWRTISAGLRASSVKPSPHSIRVRPISAHRSRYGGSARCATAVSNGPPPATAGMPAPRRRLDLAPCRAFVGHHPARHRDLQRAHQVPALLQVRLRASRGRSRDRTGTWPAGSESPRSA